jgi:heat shock protein HtpX
MKNNLKVALLMAMVTALLVVVGRSIGGSTGMIIAIAMALVMNIGSYWFSDKIVLAMTRAEPVTEAQAPELFRMVRNLSQRAGIPMPRLYVVPDLSPNAFATGRNPKNGVVAVNQGLLQMLDHYEVEGVIAHEIAHIKHRDTLTSAVVATVAGAISGLANMAMFASLFGSRSDDGEGSPIAGLLSMIFAPIAATMIQLAVSRAREYEADRYAAQLTGKPFGLKRALLKLEQGVGMMPGGMSPSAAHMCIVNPFGGAAMSGLMKLFSTHPPTIERVRKLEEYEATMVAQGAW